jgi:hypothetical protein
MVESIVFFFAFDFITITEETVQQKDRKISINHNSGVFIINI